MILYPLCYLFNLNDLGGTMTSQVIIMIDSENRHKINMNLLKKMIEDNLHSVIEVGEDDNSLNINIYHEHLED